MAWDGCAIAARCARACAVRTERSDSTRRIPTALPARCARCATAVSTATEHTRAGTFAHRVHVGAGIWAHPSHMCAGAGLTPAYICARTVPNLRQDWASALAHPHRDWAPPSHICAGTGLAPPLAGVLARWHEDVTVIFCDIVGFSAMCTQVCLTRAPARTCALTPAPARSCAHTHTRAHPHTP
jgi:hypothetical protein